MILAAQDVLDLLPDARQAAYQLHDTLTGVAFFFSVLGITTIGVRASQTGNLNRVMPALVRLIVAVILIDSLGAWCNAINDAVRSLVNDMGVSFGGINQPGTAFQAYRAAIQRKWGTNNAAPQNNAAPNLGIWAGNTAPNNVSGGVTLSHYGYEKPGDKYYDSNSAAGIGAFGFSSAPGSLRSGLSAALSQDVADNYHVTPGHSFNVNLANGQTLTLTYADKVGNDDNGNPIPGRIDIYDPTNSLGSLSGVSVTGINDTGVDNTVSNQTGGIGGLLKRTGDVVVMALAGPAVYLLSLVAAGLMWIMTVAQQVLFLADVSLSPIFIGMLVVPELVPIAANFLASLLALTLWPIGWAFSDVVTRALVDAAVNPTNNLGQALASVTGAPWAMWVLLALWVIGSSIFAPLYISRLVTGSRGLPGLGQVLASSFLAATNAARPGSLASRTVSAGSGALRSIRGGLNASNGSSGALPPAGGNRLSPGTARPNYARRPVARNQVIP